MRVLAHCDPWFLEEMLVERVRALKRSDALAPVLVIVPTGRLAAHVRRRLAQRVGALLQVEVLHHRGVALRILESRPGTPRQPASRLLLETLLEGVLREQPANPVARYVAERPGALGSLMATIRDLREAGVTPAELEEACRSRSEAALAGIYGAYHERLEDGVKPGLMDDASFVKAALAEAPRFARRYVEIVHHGAYELIGIHLELVRALDRQTPVTFLVPLATAAPAYAYAERFVRRHLLCACDESAGREGVGGSLLGGRLVTLGDEKARTPPLQPGSVAFRHAQGETSEIEAAVRFAIQEVGAGCPPEEIAIIARSLAPYRGAIEASLGDAGIPFVSTLAAPLRREPAVHDLLLLLKAAAEDFPRAPTAEILGSRRLRWRRLGLGDRPPSGDLAEAWSRRAGLVGGLEAWTRELPEWAADFRLREDAAESEIDREARLAPWRRDEARRIAEAVEALARRISAGTARGWKQHADWTGEIARDLIGLEDEDLRAAVAMKALSEILEDMGRVEDLPGERRAVSFHEMVAWLERATNGASLPLTPADRGGVRVLDAPQARGLTFRRVFLVGLNAGVFPRTARVDPFLSDRTRERLRDSTGKAVPVRSEGIDEEHLLVTLLLGAARERLDISWQRADAAGATRSPSLFLREVARAVLGAADLDELLRSAAALPSHPGERLERVTREPGLLSPEENVLLSAFRARGDPSRAARLAELDPTLGPGLRMLTATESFAPGDLGFDGRIADAVPRPGALSVSAFGRLGECPLKFFFRDVLDVRELKEPASLFEVDKTDLGNRVHALLDALYRRLHREGLFVTGRATDLVDRAECWLEQAWRDAFAVMDARWRRRAPLLAESLMGKWLTSLRGFLREDLARLTAEGWTDPDFEASRAVNLDVHPETIRLEGRLDREFRQGERRLIGDYKTGAITGLADPARMLKGASLQVPLYRLLAGGSPTVEVLGVGPMHDPVQGEPVERRVVFEGFAAGDLDEGFRETARVLLDLVFRGRFPLRADDHCAWCPYARACRHRHPPTLERERNAKDASDFVDLAGKSTKKPTLETVRAGGNALDAVEE